MTPRRYYSQTIQRTKTPEQRFWEKVETCDTCWIWTGAVRNGYGAFDWRGKLWRAHRLAYTLRIGEIPDGLDIDHTCRQRLCVNPVHLQAVERRLNLENRSGARRDSKSGIRGVRWDPARSKWIAYANSDGRRYWGGAHATPEEAERAAIALRNQVMTNNLADRNPKER